MPPDTAPVKVIAPVPGVRLRLLPLVLSVELNRTFPVPAPVLKETGPARVTPGVNVIASLVVVMLPAVVTAPVLNETAPSDVIVPAAFIVVPEESKLIVPPLPVVVVMGLLTVTVPAVLLYTILPPALTEPD